MYRENDCGCEHHEERHEERSGERHEGRGDDCGCGGHGEGQHGERSESGGERHHGHHGMGGGMHRGGYCCCQMHHMGGFGHGGMMGRGMGMGMGMGMGFGRRFINRDEIIGRLEEYLKELQGEAKGVEERIAELKRKGESQQA